MRLFHEESPAARGYRYTHLYQEIDITEVNDLFIEDQWLFQGTLSPEEVVHNAETGVSLIQVAEQNVQRILMILQMMEEKLQEEWTALERQECPDSELNPLIQFQKACLEEIAAQTQFKGRQLLNGDLGISGQSSGFRVLGASHRERSWKTENITIELMAPATSSSLTGPVPLTERMIQNESHLTFFENQKTVVYPIKHSETVATLLEGLRKLMLKQCLDLKVSLNQKGHLQIEHNQHGSGYQFSAMSEKTTILSRIPGVPESAAAGEDCQGMINEKIVKGFGDRFALKGDHPRDHLYILCESNVPGQEKLTVSFTPLPIQIGRDADEILPVYINSCYPEDLGWGIRTMSGFRSLAETRITHWQSVYDAFLVLSGGKIELQRQLERFKHYQELLHNLALSRLADLHTR